MADWMLLIFAVGLIGATILLGVLFYALIALAITALIAGAYFSGLLMLGTLLFMVVVIATLFHAILS